MLVNLELGREIVVIIKRSIKTHRDASLRGNMERVGICIGNALCKNTVRRIYVPPLTL
jgi:hypothetical protein